MIGLDVGMKRIGIARASSVARIAEPLETIETAKIMPHLKKLVEQHSVDTIVVGLPRNLEGNDTAQTQWVRDWLDSVKPKIKGTFYWQDEALTTKVAEAAEQAYKKTKDNDAFAAAVILQDFLNTPESERVVC